MTQAQIEAIKLCSVPNGLFTGQEQQVLLLTKEVYRGRTISDEDFAGMTQGLTSREIVELLLLIGFYMMLARFLMVLQIEIDEPAGERLLAPPAPESLKES